MRDHAREGGIGRACATLLTPTWRGHDQSGDHLLADNGRIGGRRRTDEALDDVVGDPHDAAEIGRLGARRAHHHAERLLLLEHALEVHHVQVAHDRPVYHHDLVALDYTCNRERESRRVCIGTRVYIE